MTDIDPQDVTVLKLLARGRDPEWVAEATNRKPDVVRIVGEKHGWPDLEKLRAELDAADVGDTIPVKDEEPARPRLTPAVMPQQTGVVGPAGKLELLLARAAKHDTAPVRAARDAALNACARLESRLAGIEATQRERQERDAAKAAARSRVVLLEKQLREAKAALRGKPVKQSKPAPSTTEDAKTVRAWATANNVACPAVGRVPAAVVEQYRAATQGRTA